MRVDVLAVRHRARRDVGAQVGGAVHARAAPLSGSAREAGAGAEAVHVAGEGKVQAMNICLDKARRVCSLLLSTCGVSKRVNKLSFVIFSFSIPPKSH